jgi:hypothetical protein
MAHAVHHFRSILHRFSLKFFLLLEGEPVAPSYVVNRMLVEFAAATVVFSRANEKSRYVDCDDNSENGVDGDGVGEDGDEDGDEDDGNGSDEDGNDTDDGGITNGEVETQVVALLQGSHKKLFPYYKHCVDQHHKHFLWTGPKLQILPRSDDIAATISHTSRGEVLDLPSHPIYHVDADHSPVTNATEAHVKQPRSPGKNVSCNEGEGPYIRHIEKPHGPGKSASRDEGEGEEPYIRRVGQRRVRGNSLNLQKSKKRRL